MRASISRASTRPTRTALPHFGVQRQAAKYKRGGRAAAAAGGGRRLGEQAQQQRTLLGGPHAFREPRRDALIKQGLEKELLPLVPCFLVTSSRAAPAGYPLHSCTHRQKQKDINAQLPFPRLGPRHRGSSRPKTRKFGKKRSSVAMKQLCCPGGQGHRSLYLSHAKRALYHLS